MKIIAALIVGAVFDDLVLGACYAVLDAAQRVLA